MQDAEIIEVSRKFMGRGLFFGCGHITKATDKEILEFAREIERAVLTERQIIHTNSSRILSRIASVIHSGAGDEILAKIVRSEFSMR
jgi:hypothetical protein